MALQKPSAADVIALTQTDLPEPVVSAIIDDAALMAENCLSTKSAAVQEAALKWLAAHLIASTSDEGSQTISSTKLGDASDSYARATTGDGVSGTTYGQQAIALAPCLAYLGRARAKVTVV